MIQKATVADAKTVAALAVQMWDSAAAAELEQEFVETLQQDDSAVYLYIADEKAVGFAQCGLRQDYVEGTSSSPVGYLEGVFVEETYRRRGIAGKLVEACEQWAVEKGCTEFASDCELCNTASIAFHQSMGFVEANRIVCFCKELSRQDDVGKVYARCGNRCDLCLLYRPNVQREDRRKEICALFEKIWTDFHPDPQTIICDGCTCTKENAVLFSPDCETRKCVNDKKYQHCGYCENYPCSIFPAEPTEQELIQKIEVEKRWTWEEEKLMEAYSCRRHMDAFRQKQK